MNKNLPILFSVIAAALFVVGAARSQVKAQATATEYPSALATQGRAATVTPMPTATVDYQQTAIVAQSTADEARRVNAQATAEHEKYLSIVAQATMSANELELARVWQTATYAPTAVALELTRTAGNVAVADMRLQEVKIYATTTAAAPQLLRDMKYAEAYNAIAEFWTAIIVKLALSALIIGVLVILWVVPRKPEKMSVSVVAPVDYKPIPAQETVLQVKRGEAEYPRMDVLIVPCAPATFGAFVNAVITEKMPLSYAHMVGRDAPFTTNTEYGRFRVWLQTYRLVQSIGQGGLTLTVDGEQLLTAWHETQELPEKYHFLETEKSDEAK